ncbi:MAG: hypothetical protein LW806_03250 [Planctomycetaceae bacterium]|nr:hypothetical protein [Planctomycetaceae bacterium]
MATSSALPATRSAPPEALGTMVALVDPPAAPAARSSRNCRSVSASSDGGANSTGITAVSRFSATRVFSSASRSDFTSACCASVARTTSCRALTTGITREPAAAPCASHGRCGRSPSVSRTSAATCSMSPDFASYVRTVRASPSAGATSSVATISPTRAKRSPRPITMSALRFSSARTVAASSAVAWPVSASICSIVRAISPARACRSACTLNSYPAATSGASKPFTSSSISA